MDEITPPREDQNRSRIPRRLRRAVQLAGYLGPGFFVTVGFIDPGNWATNIAAGSHYNYDLLWVVALGTGVLILWQHMSAHLGIVSGKCLAEAARANFRPAATYLFGVTAMAACVATALAEILGAALGLEILLGVPLRSGVVVSTAFVIAMTWRNGYNSLEKWIVGLVSLIGLCYMAELYLVKPDWASAAYHTFVPKLSSHSIVIAMGVLGAIMMPHNIYLHSEVIQKRRWANKPESETRHLLRFEFVDTLVAMLVGMAINAAMVIVAAAVFFKHGIHVTELTQASATLEPLVGKSAQFLFGIALLFAGISSSMTAAVAGGTTFTGYLGKETEISSKWFRVGVILTLIPAALIIFAIHDVFEALVISQVCLGVQLPLTMLPLFLLTNNKRVMGKLTNRWLENSLMVITGLVIVALNFLLIWQVFGGHF